MMLVSRTTRIMSRVASAIHVALCDAAAISASISSGERWSGPTSLAVVQDCCSYSEIKSRASTSRALAASAALCSSGRPIVEKATLPGS
jgi:hypothetical protein